MSRPRVAIDGRPLQGKPLGVMRYLSGVLPVLAKHVDMFVLLDARRPSPTTSFAGGIDWVHLGCPPRLPGLAWLEVAVTPWLRRSECIFHGTFNVLPLSYGGPSVLTIHDLAPQLHGEDFRSLKRAVWRMNMRIGVSRATRVTTVSHFVKSQIVTHFGLKPERVLVAPDALAPVFSPERVADAPELMRRLGINPPYIVALGGAPRRGLSVAIEAWREVNQQLRYDSPQATDRDSPPVSLVVAGERRVPAEPGLVSVGYQDDESWATLLAGAKALCYPTRYEGFGLPALEAAASGTPVVCAPVASLPEVLGDAGCWASAPTPAEITSVLARVLRDPYWHRQRRAAGLERAAQAPSWSQSAEVLLQAYRIAEEPSAAPRK